LYFGLKSLLLFRPSAVLDQVLVVAAKQAFSWCPCRLQDFGPSFGRSTLRREAGSESTVAQGALGDIFCVTTWGDFASCLVLQHQELLGLRVDETTFIVADLREAASSSFDTNHFPETSTAATHRLRARLNKWTVLILRHLEIIMERIIHLSHGHGNILLHSLCLIVGSKRQIG